MGFRYQDLDGQEQVASDLRALQLALKSGRILPDTPVLDESINVRLKAAALIAFKAREAGAASTPATAAPPPARNTTAVGAGRADLSASRAPTVATRAPSPARTAPSRKNAPWFPRLMMGGAALSAIVLVAGFVMSAQERAQEKAAAREDMKSLAKTARDTAKEIEKDLPPAGAQDSPAKPLPKVPSSGRDMLTAVVPLLRQSQLVMVQNSTRHQQEMDQLNLSQVMAPETLLSRDGIARNNVRIKSFRASLDRLDQDEDARIKKLIADVRSTLANRSGGPEFAKGFEEGINRSRKNQDQFILIQGQLAQLFQSVTDFMASRQGSVSVRGSTMVFANDADVATYQQFMKDLDRLAREEEAVQRKMAEAMKHSAQQLEELSK